MNLCSAIIHGYIFIVTKYQYLFLVLKKNLHAHIVQKYIKKIAAAAVVTVRIFDMLVNYKSMCSKLPAKL